MMHGIDIASHQTGIDLSKVPCDFVICKATGGTGYVSPDFKRQVEQALAEGKCAGAYHFALDGFTGTTPEREAQHFLNAVEPYLGKIALALDWEAKAVKLGAGWAKRWLDYVYDKTGIRAMIYMSKGKANSKVWAEVAKNHPLWVTQYAISTNKNYQPGYTPVRGYLSNPPGEKSVGPWGENITIRQYTSMGFLNGYPRRLDLDLAYIDRAGWDKLCGKTSAPVEPVEPETPEKPEKLTVDELARQVLDRKWGNGTERKQRLEAAGYDYAAVQKRVNELVAKMSTGTAPITPPTSDELTAAEIEALAIAVRRGDYGNGAVRRAKLGSKYEAVQKRVNEIDAERRKVK